MTILKLNLKNKKEKMTYKYSWDLEKYFYKSVDDIAFKSDLDAVLQDLKNFIKKYKWEIKKFEKAEQLLKFYEEDEKISLKLNKIFHFVFYLNSLNTQDQTIIKKIMELEHMFVEIQNELLFVDEEFKKLGAKKLLQFSKDKKLENYKYYLIEKARNLKYLLSKKEEKLLNEYQGFNSQIENLYNEFSNGMEFEIDWKKVTEWEVRSMRSSKDPIKRRKAYKILKQEYNKQYPKTVLANIYSSFVKNRLFDVKIRKYKTVMEPRNISENLDNEVVDLLMSEVMANYGLFQRYVQIKSKFLWQNLPLEIEDIFAPIVESVANFTPEQAIEKHLKVMKKFDKDFYDYSLDLLENARVDFNPKTWKRWWAFASYSKWQESFVLLNFTWKLNDISTLSHEFGHAIHGKLSQKQNEKVYDSPLSLAETASIFNEMLLSEDLLSDDKLTKNDKIFLLESKLGEIFSTIFRQIQYVDFEKTVHEKIQKWEQFSHEDYCKLRRKTQEKMSGNTIKYDVPAEQESWWSWIPHIFHTPFYCYAYAFWNILTFSLYWNYKKQGKKFVQDYKKILESGWSTPPKELLQKYWIDITSKKFYKNAFEQIEKMLDELEELAN